MTEDPRSLIGRTLCGDVLEVGPGSKPFPTSADARVRYADRSVPGGRDANWPELIGQPWGPEGHVDVDLDKTGLAAVPDASLDAVVACHVIEHLANPLFSLVEFERVLRPQGRLVLIVPDRKLTFDWVREPTRVSHLLAEFRRGVTEVDDDHIMEFCRAIYMQPPIHPQAVYEWHNPMRLNAALFDLHRRRSIHVHCWSPEEFAVTIAGALAEGLMTWKLSSLYFVEDQPNAAGHEFGLVLTRSQSGQTPQERCFSFVKDWTDLALKTSKCSPARVATLGRELRRELGHRHDLKAVVAWPGSVLADLGVSRRTELWEPTAIRRLLLRTKQATRELPVVRKFC